jgi:RimJ/RimL family protein N-acetyltransferase
MARAPKEVRRCRWRSTAGKARSIRKFLRAYGDDLPEADIRDSTKGKKLQKWTTVCDRKNKLVGLMRYTQNDWYLCTLKNAAVRPGLRGKGIGGRIYKQTAQRALRNRSCLVLAADVTYDNHASKRLLEKVGFTPVNRFCWGDGQKPADILHYVKMPSSGTPKHPRCKV